MVYLPRQASHDLCGQPRCHANCQHLKQKEHLYPVYGTLMTMPGIPCIYYGSEWGEEGVKAPDNDYALRPCFDAPKPNELTSYIKKLISFRQKSDALCNGSYRNVMITNRQLIFERRTDREQILLPSMLKEPNLQQITANCRARSAILQQTHALQ